MVGVQTIFPPDLAPESGQISPLPTGDRLTHYYECKSVLTVLWEGECEDKLEEHMGRSPAEPLLDADTSDGKVDLRLPGHRTCTFSSPLPPGEYLLNHIENDIISGAQSVSPACTCQQFAGPKLLAKELLDLVASHFNLKEKEYFGIAFTDETREEGSCHHKVVPMAEPPTGHLNWLQLDRRVLEHDFPKKSGPVVLYFCVRVNTSGKASYPALCSFFSCEDDSIVPTGTLSCLAVGPGEPRPLSSQLWTVSVPLGDTVLHAHGQQFYIESISYLKDNATIELFFLNAKSCIYKELIDVDSEVVFELASYILQFLKIITGAYTEKGRVAAHQQDCLLKDRPLKNYSYVLTVEILGFIDSNGSQLSLLVGSKPGLPNIAVTVSHSTWKTPFLRVAVSPANICVFLCHHVDELKDKQGIPWWLGLSYKGIFQYDYHDKVKPRKDPVTRFRISESMKPKVWIISH
ncbi:hypothetical protein PANDA_018858 [Ailuropoda melanoleuca]|uniref:Uncharacterized protein n=1 Tax=Ailuropoda melanoleuca TaxID=9646 RepID=D2I0V3_AILME|nr:hypothetical protein PANDA_018858 [Ailuropoda melanoleuca]